MADETGSRDPRREEPPRPPPGLDAHVGKLGIILFEIYYFSLGLVIAYVLWRVWPYDPSTLGEPIQILGATWRLPGGLEGRLIFIAALSGLLGSYIHAARSFAVYVGLRQLRRSWLLWYSLLPITGMTLGLFFYVVLRAGFISANDPSSVDPFGVATIAGLAGMFSDKATQKLKGVFDQILKTTQETGDGLSGRGRGPLPPEDDREGDGEDQGDANARARSTSDRDG